MAEDFCCHQVRERIHANGLTRLLLHTDMETMRRPLEFYQLSKIGVMLGACFLSLWRSRLCFMSEARRKS
jgi:hypothetical protein